MKEIECYFDSKMVEFQVKIKIKQNMSIKISWMYSVFKLEDQSHQNV